MTDESPTDGAKDGAGAKEGGFDPSDLDSLVSLARSSEDHEAYRVVAKREHFRVGLAASAAADASASFRIEILLQVLARDSKPKVADLERTNRILGDLTKRGYSLDHHDSCWVICEREVAVEDIEKECLAVIETIQRKEGVKI